MSTRITVDSSGLKALGKRIDGIGKKADTERQPMMDEISLFLHGKAVGKLRGKRSGRIYEQGKFYPRAGGVGVFKRILPTHQASAPGESPKNDSGFLLGSLRHKATRRFAIIGSRLGYAEVLEEKLDRPWLKPTLEESEPAINQIIAKHIAKAIS